MQYTLERHQLLNHVLLRTVRFQHQLDRREFWIMLFLFSFNSVKFHGRQSTTISNKDQSNLAKGDIVLLIMTSGTAHILSIASIIFARWQRASRSWSWRCTKLRLTCGEGEVAGVSDGTIRKSDCCFLQALHCVVSNHSAAICRRMPSNVFDAQINRSLWGKIWEEGVNRCKPNFNAICERHWAFVCEITSTYLLPFEHNLWTWQTDRETRER